METQHKKKLLHICVDPIQQLFKKPASCRRFNPKRRYKLRKERGKEKEKRELTCDANTLDKMRKQNYKNPMNGETCKKEDKRQTSL